MGRTTIQVSEETLERFKDERPFESLSADEFLNELLQSYNDDLEMQLRGAIHAWENSAISMIARKELDGVGEQFARDYWTVSQELRHILGEVDEPVGTTFSEMQQQIEDAAQERVEE